MKLIFQKEKIELLILIEFDFFRELYNSYDIDKVYCYKKYMIHYLFIIYLYLYILAIEKYFISYFLFIMSIFTYLFF